MSSLCDAVLSGTGGPSDRGVLYCFLCDPPPPPDDDVFGVSFTLQSSTSVGAISSSSLDRLRRLDLNECAASVVVARGTNVGCFRKEAFDRKYTVFYLPRRDDCDG